MSTEVWYRKWRPQRFGDVAGQEHITRTLANAVDSGRIAHAYLFCGPRGTGKTSTARILAKAANCRQNEAGEPCDRCSNCRDLAEGRALDLVEMDAASNRGIDEVRSLRDKVGYSPTSSTYKIYLIDEVHELTAHAFDALLKTLEEPPPHVIFVLATTEAERVPATIVSRCQRYDFRRIRQHDVIGRLEQVCAGESVLLPVGAAAMIARRATGSLRDAINLLEQVVAAHGSSPDLSQVETALGIGGSEFAARLVHQALAGDLAGAFGVIGAARDEGVEPRQLQRSAVDYLRSLMMIKAGAESTLELSEEALLELRSEGVGSDVALVVRLLRYLSSVDFRSDALSPLPLELALAQAILEPELVAAPEVVRPLPATASPTQRPVREQRPAGAGYAARPSPTPPRPSPVPSDPAAAPAAARISAPARHQPVEPLTGDLTVDRLQGLMGTIYDRLKSQRSLASAFINSKCNIMSLEDEEITLTFAHDAVAAKFRDSGGEHVNAVEGVIESLSGKRYRLQVSVDPAVEGWQRAPATARTSHLLDEAEKLGLRRQ
ncbi:MAG TPA: DNA polymerase III subunit gamma/tau [Dehalococcoidia bacterium]|nr:DNA polymerase III subunit gamma/tau [Dehalococcoidia bacterium]